MKDWLYVGAEVKTKDDKYYTVLNISENNGVQLDNYKWYCRTELTSVENKPSKTELIDKAIDDLGGDISKAYYHYKGYNNLWRSGANYLLASDDSIAHIQGNTFCTIEEFEQRKKEREMEKNDWYDYENQKMLKSPPVGEIVLVNMESGERKAKVLEITNNHHSEIFVVRVFNSSIEGIGDLRYKDNAKPLDWDKLSKRKQVLSKAEEIFNETGYCKLYLEKLYDAGMLKLPEDK